MKNHSRPAVRTPEFWLVLLAQALPLLAILGVLAPDEVEVLNELAEAAINNGFVFISSAAALIIWVRERFQDLRN